MKQRVKLVFGQLDAHNKKLTSVNFELLPVYKEKCIRLEMELMPKQRTFAKARIFLKIELHSSLLISVLLFI